MRRLLAPDTRSWCRAAPAPLAGSQPGRSALRSLVATPLMACLVAVSGCELNVEHRQHTAREERRFTVSGTPTLTLTTFDGAVEVRASDRAEIVVEIEKRGATQAILDAIEVVVDEADDRISIEARYDRHGLFTDFDIGLDVSPSASLVALVPRRTDLSVDTGNGSIMVEQVVGRIELHTSDGRIRGIDLEGTVRAHSGDGRIRLESITGAVDASSGDGGVTVGGELTSARLTTGDGSISLRVEPGSTMERDWEITTGDGGIVVYLPAGFDAEVDARTADGRVSADEALSFSLERAVSRRRLQGRIGSGGRPLRIRTGDGSIRLRVP